MNGHPSGDTMLLAALSQAGLDTVEGAFAFAGGEDLNKPKLGNRRRTRLVLMDAAGRTHLLYLKRYGREPLFARLRRAITRNCRRSPAAVEFDNILAARAAGVATMEGIICNTEPGPLGGRRSYLVVTSVPGEALERSGKRFVAGCADRPGKLAELTDKLAAIVSNLHRAGCVHRDLYAAHVFAHEDAENLNLYLIDLARMFSPRLRKFRWRVKDLAQLKYSMPPAWVAGCWDAFLAGYLRAVASRRVGRYNRAIDRKVAAMRRRSRRKITVRRRLRANQ